MTDDAELLRCYAEEKSEEAFAELVRRRIGLVYSVAWRHTRDAQRAEDVTQAVFTALARKAGELARRPVLVGWLYRSAQFAASDAVRVEVRRQAREQEAHTMNENERNAPEPDWAALRPVIDEGLNVLVERDRDAVLLRFFDGRSFAEIGTRLNLNENAARMRVERALAKLHTALARRGVKSTTAALGVAMAGQAGAAVPAGLAVSVTTGALAGAAAGVGARGWCAVAFMKTTKLIIGGLGLLLLIAVGFGFREQRCERDANEALATVTEEKDRLAALLRKSEEKLREKPAETKAAVAVGNVEVRPTAHEIEAAVEAELDRVVAGNPELQQLYVRQQTMRLRSRYGAFYRSAGLTRVQIEKFERAMADRAQAAIDFPAVAVAQGLKKSDPAVLKLSHEAEEVKARALREVLGDAAYSELRNYERTSALRGVARELAGELYFTEAPLGARQADQLTEIVAASRGEKGAQVDWDYVLAEVRSRGVLSPEQIAVLAEKKEQTEVGARIGVLIKSWRDRFKPAPEK